MTTTDFKTSHELVALPLLNSSQNMRLLIDSVEKRAMRLQSKLSPDNYSDDTEAFFNNMYIELQSFRKYLNFFNLNQRPVYIYQMLCIYTRHLYEYSDYSDNKLQFNAIRRSLENSKYELSEHDKSIINATENEFYKFEKEAGSSLSNEIISSNLSYLSKILYDRTTLSLWRAEEFRHSQKIMAFLLIMVLVIFFYLVFCISDEIALKGSIDKPSMVLLLATLSGLIGGILSVIATARSNFENHNNATKVPIIGSGWIRPLLGGRRWSIFWSVCLGGHQASRLLILDRW